MNDTRVRKKIVDDIKMYGWHVMKVLPERDVPRWAYSIGFFKTFKQPEVIAFGLPQDTLQALINNVGEEIRTGVEIGDGLVDDDLLEGYSCVFRAVPEVWFDRIIGQAQWFYGGAAFPLLQLFWPDRKQKFPWDKECDPAVKALQPRLYASDAKSAGAEWLLT
jgi:hypothetical protein